MKQNLPTLSPNSLVAAAEHDRSDGAFHGLQQTDRAAHEEILHRAYAIWESEGHPDNRNLDHWLQAEKGILGESSQL